MEFISTLLFVLVVVSIFFGLPIVVFRLVYKEVSTSKSLFAALVGGVAVGLLMLLPFSLIFFVYAIVFIIKMLPYSVGLGVFFSVLYWVINRRLETYIEPLHRAFASFFIGFTVCIVATISLWAINSDDGVTGADLFMIILGSIYSAFISLGAMIMLGDNDV